MDILLTKIYAATINFVQRFNSDKVLFKLKVSIYNKNKQITSTYTKIKHVLVVRKSVVFAQLQRMSSSLNSTNLELVGHFENNNNKKGGYATRERDIRKIRHLGPGCSDIWIPRVF